MNEDLQGFSSLTEDQHQQARLLARFKLEASSEEERAAFAKIATVVADYYWPDWTESEADWMAYSDFLTLASKVGA